MICLLMPINHSGRLVRFLALAGHSGLVAEIDAQVQMSALQRAAAWRGAGSELRLEITEQTMDRKVESAASNI